MSNLCYELLRHEVKRVDFLLLLLPRVDYPNDIHNSIDTLLFIHHEILTRTMEHLRVCTIESSSTTLMENMKIGR